MLKIRKTAKVQETIQSSTTPDPGYHMRKKQKYNKHHINNKSQEVSPFPAGDRPQGSNKQTRKHEKHKTHKTQKIHKKANCLSKCIHNYFFQKKYNSVHTRLFIFRRVKGAPLIFLLGLSNYQLSKLIK